MTRIRYKKKYNCLHTEPFIAINQVVSATIYPELFKASVCDEDSYVLKELYANNLQNLKKLVKKTLIEMGVVFEPEVRPRFSESMNKDLDEVDGDDFI
jgi:hypothetical protein